MDLEIRPSRTWLQWMNFEESSNSGCATLRTPTADKAIVSQVWVWKDIVPEAAPAFGRTAHQVIIHMLSIHIQ